MVFRMLYNDWFTHILNSFCTAGRQDGRLGNELQSLFPKCGQTQLVLGTVYDSINLLKNLALESVFRGLHVASYPMEASLEDRQEDNQEREVGRRERHLFD